MKRTFTSTHASASDLFISIGIRLIKILYIAPLRELQIWIGITLVETFEKIAISGPWG